MLSRAALKKISFNCLPGSRLRRRLDWRGGGRGQLRIAEGCRKLEVPRRLSAGWNCAKGLLLSTGGGGLEYEAEWCKRWIVVMQVHTFSNRPSELLPWAWECAGGGLDPGICARQNVLKSEWMSGCSRNGPYSTTETERFTRGRHI